ncbi:hypothetical protein POKO110462_00450 [Pontibacter korlensis]|uniref:Uncharacterized protein n=1 Tax=Pontibacter korlensis TaxID=400092 RepID=A0A0E3ZCQ7_9BACT|nr:hypothetical protein [Pontibacter korlensis]AKD02750.1 hypothetical protein PKOR_05980 [Pontibacter korlensis]
MFKAWEKVRDFLPMAAVLLLCMLVMPATQAYADNNNGSSATTTTVQTQVVQPGQETKAGTDKARPKPTATKPQDKSVLDSDVLESPLAYFRDAFTPEEEDSNDASGAGVIMITIKALIATLLSTVM